MKVEYKPDNKKRFSISEDKISRERVYKLLEVFKTLDKTFPELKLGFSLFGSLAKGKKIDARTALDTDLDLQIIYDNSYYTKDKNNFNIENDKLEDLLARVDINKEELLKYRNDQIDKIEEGGVMVGSKTKDWLKSGDVSDYTFLELYIKKTVSDTLGEEVDINFNIETVNLNRENPYSWTRNDMGYLKLNAFFGLDLGGGMKRHIKGFLRDMKKEFTKNEAEKEWKHIRRMAMLSERVMFSPKDHTFMSFSKKLLLNSLRLLFARTIRSRYPKTFQDACKYYKV